MHLPGAEVEAALVDRTLNSRRAEILLKPNTEGSGVAMGWAGCAGWIKV